MPRTIPADVWRALCDTLTWAHRAEALYTGSFPQIARMAEPVPIVYWNGSRFVQH